MKYSLNKYIFLIILAISGASRSAPVYEGYGKLYSTTDQPKDKYIDRKIDIDRSGIQSKLDLENNKKLLLNTNAMEIKAFKDKDNINKIRILSEYDLYLNNKLESSMGYINIVCPVTEEIRKDKSEIIEQKIVDGEEITSLKPASEIVSQNILYPGNYSFFSKPDEKKVILPYSPDNNYLNAQVNIICRSVVIQIMKNELHEINRDKISKRFDTQP